MFGCLLERYRDPVLNKLFDFSHFPARNLSRGVPARLPEVKLKLVLASVLPSSEEIPKSATFWF